MNNVKLRSSNYGYYCFVKKKLIKNRDSRDVDD